MAGDAAPAPKGRMRGILLYWVVPTLLAASYWLVMECNFHCVWEDNQSITRASLSGSIIESLIVAFAATCLLNLMRYMVLSLTGPHDRTDS